MIASSVELCEGVAVAEPRLRPLLDEHMADNRELLAHVFFGEVTHWVEERAGEPAEVRAVLDFLEAAVADVAPDAENVILVSFLEHLDARVVALLGPHLRRAYHSLPTSPPA